MIAEFNEGLKLRKHRKVQPNAKPLVQSKILQRKSPTVPVFGAYLDGSENSNQLK